VALEQLGQCLRLALPRLGQQLLQSLNVRERWRHGYLLERPPCFNASACRRRTHGRLSQDSIPHTPNGLRYLAGATPALVPGARGVPAGAVTFAAGVKVV